MADAPHYEMYIDGRWAGAAETFEVRSPARGELVATVAQGDLASVDAAVAAAKAAHESGLCLENSCSICRRGLCGSWLPLPPAH